MTRRRPVATTTTTRKALRQPSPSPLAPPKGRRRRRRKRRETRTRPSAISPVRAPAHGALARQPSARSLPPAPSLWCGLTRGRSLTAPAYRFFNKKRFPELKIEHPDWKFGDFSRAVSAEWKQLDDATKAPYELEAATDKTRYEQQMLTYVPPRDDGTPETKRKKKDPNAPKRNQPCACAWLMARWLASRQPALSLPLPLSGAACGLTRGRSLTAPAYGFFNMKRRAELKIENPDWKFGDLSRAVSAEWKQLDEAAKAPWQAQANEDKTRYEQQMASYSSSSPSPSSSPSDISAN
jgi:hypothetical protein